MKLSQIHLSMAGLVTAILIGFLLYQNFALKRAYESLMRAQNGGTSGVREKSARHEDPYNAKAVKNTIIKNAPAISACYKSYLAGKPAVSQGKVKADWEITDSGRVKNPSIIATAFNDSNFDTCLVKSISMIEFPPPPVDRFYVEHTFTFQEDKNAK